MFPLSFFGQGSAVPTSVVRQPRTTGITIGPYDATTLVDIVGGTFVQRFGAASELGPKFYFWMRNSGVGAVTLQSNSSDLIDGSKSYTMFPGEARLFQCDGIGFNSIIIAQFTRPILSSGTFNPPPGYQYFEVEVLGAGGGGGSGGSVNGTNSGGQGGLGGGWGLRRFTPSEFGSSVTIVIGAGGPGGPGTLNTFGLGGSLGGDTTVTTAVGTMTVTGGAAGAGGSTAPISATTGAGTYAGSTADTYLGAVSAAVPTDVIGPNGQGRPLAGSSGGNAGGSSPAGQRVGGPGGSRGLASGGGGAGGAAATIGTAGVAFSGGGGGGGSNTSLAGGGGGAGGIGSGGGGGGSQSNITPALSGTGGTGGNGFVIIRGI